MRRWQSGQLHQTVNLTPYGLQGSNPSYALIKNARFFIWHFLLVAEGFEGRSATARETGSRDFSAEKYL